MLPSVDGSLRDPNPLAERADHASPSDFVHVILDNLRKAGVQNTKNGERLTFDRLDIYPGEHLHAEGTYTENGKSKRVAVGIRPEARSR